MIPYGRQDINDNDIQAVVDVLKSDFLTQGQIVPKFESKIAEYCGVRHSVAVNSATSALHIACLAMDVAESDIVWTSAISFVASANCALYCGAKIDFIDIDSATNNLSISHLKEKLDLAEKSNKLPKVIIPVHLSGQSCDMVEIYNLSKKYNFKIIEDASHAIGAEYNSKKIGSCEYSDITVFSFHPVKIITSGEGGMALTNSEKLSKKMMKLRNHGITREKDEFKNNSCDPWYYEQLNLGFNYRMSDIHAALGLSQFNRLDNFIKKRNLIANKYNQSLSELRLSLPVLEKNCLSAWHLYIIKIDQENCSRSHVEIFNLLRQEGIGVQLHYIPIPMHPYFTHLGFNINDYTNAKSYYQRAISIPIYPLMSEEEQDKVIKSLRKIIF